MKSRSVELLKLCTDNLNEVFDYDDIESNDCYCGGDAGSISATFVINKEFFRIIIVNQSSKYEDKIHSFKLVKPTVKDDNRDFVIDSGHINPAILKELPNDEWINIMNSIENFFDKIKDTYNENKEI